MKILYTRHTFGTRHTTHDTACDDTQTRSGTTESRQKENKQTRSASKELVLNPNLRRSVFALICFIQSMLDDRLILIYHPSIGFEYYTEHTRTHTPANMHIHTDRDQSCNMHRSGLSWTWLILMHTRMHMHAYTQIAIVLLLVRTDNNTHRHAHAQIHTQIGCARTHTQIVMWMLLDVSLNINIDRLRYIIIQHNINNQITIKKSERRQLAAFSLYKCLENQY